MTMRHLPSEPLTARVLRHWSPEVTGEAFFPPQVLGMAALS